jgi:tRNA-splicing ligase RtcB
MLDKTIPKSKIIQLMVKKRALLFTGKDNSSICTRKRRIPLKYQIIGQPILIGGSLGTTSYILAGTEKANPETFGYTFLGAGRIASRSEVNRTIKYKDHMKEMNDTGIIAVTPNQNALLEEEAPKAY